MFQSLKSLFASNVPTIDVTTLKTELDSTSPPVVVDVRTPREFAGGRVRGVVNVPLADLGGHDWPDAVTLICHSGARSGRAASVLASRGIAVRNVRGGMIAWRAAGFPVS